MASKEVADRQKATDTVAQAVEQALPRVEAHFSTQFGVAPATTNEFMCGLVGGMKKATAEMAAADLANESELADDAPMRAEREARVADVRKWLPKIRSDVETHHGESGSRELGFDGPTPEDPQLLANAAALVLDRLGKWHARPSELEGEQFDPQRWIGRLAAPAGALSLAITNVAKEVGEAKVTLTDKIAKVDANDRMFSAVANVSTAVLIAVGEREMAKRTRPSVRSPGRTTEQDEGGGAVPAPLAQTG